MSDAVESHADDDPELQAEFSAFLASEEPEAPAPPDAAPALETAPEAPADRGDGRDDKGRFTPKGGTAADSRDAHSPSGDGATPPASAQPTPDPTPVLDANAPVPPESPVPPPETEPPAALEPYGVRFGTATHHIAGAVLTPDAIVVPLAAKTELDTLIGRGLKYDAEREQFKTERLQLRQARTLHEAQVQPVLDEMGQFFDLARQLHRAPDEATQLQATERLIAYAMEFAAKEPLILDRMRLEKDRAALELQRQQHEPDEQEQLAQFEATVHATVESLVGDYRQHPDASLLTDADWRVLAERVRAEPERYFYRVGPHPSPEEQAAGAVSGEVVLNARRWEQDFGERLGMRREIAAKDAEYRKALTAAQQVAKENATRTAAPAVRASAPKPPQPPASPKPAAPQDDDDFEEVMRRKFAALLE